MAITRGNNMSIRFSKLVKSARRGKNLANKMRLQIFSVVLGFLVLIVGCAYVVWLKEQGTNKSFADALWTVAFTLVGQGELASTPKTILGKMVVFLLSMLGVALLGVIVSETMQRVLSSKLRELMGMSKCKFTNHTIICGWNDRAKMMLDEFEVNGIPVAIIARERPDILSGYKDIFFVAGDPSIEEVLVRAGIESAKTVIVVADTRGNTDNSSTDARTILIVLAVEALAPEVYTLIELLDPQNERHAINAKVDDIIYCDRFLAEVLATCANNSGLSVFMRDILCSTDEGHHFSASGIIYSSQYKTIGELFASFKKNGVLPIGIIAPEKADAPLRSWKSMINPDENMSVPSVLKVISLTKNF